jgi:hypothetical protein
MVALVATAAGATACTRDDDAAAPRPAVAAAPDAAPRDHLAQGELLEGPEKAFGIPLPQGVRVDSYFPPQILASGPAVKAVDVANYLRARVASGSVKVGAASTMFDHVQAAASPGRQLNIRVEPGPAGNGVLLTIRDVTPPVIDPNLTEEQRWQQVGIAPGGRIADPTHLH